jgi:hypothetical protein
MDKLQKKKKKKKKKKKQCNKKNNARIDGVPDYTRIARNGRADQLRDEAASNKQQGLQSHGKLTILPPPPKERAMNNARNSEEREVGQLRTNHWLSGVYLKRIKKRSDDGRWFCEPLHNSSDTPRMTWTRVLLRCVVFEEIRQKT